MGAFRPPGPCPACHDHVPARRVSCPHCGATADDGWREDNGTDGLDLPDEDFDYDSFVRREFPREPAPVQFDRRTLWWITAVVLLAAMTAGYWWF